MSSPNPNPNLNSMHNQNLNPNAEPEQFRGCDNSTSQIGGWDSTDNQNLNLNTNPNQIDKGSDRGSTSTGHAATFISPSGLDSNIGSLGTKIRSQARVPRGFNIRSDSFISADLDFLNASGYLRPLPATSTSAYVRDFNTRSDSDFRTNITKYAKKGLLTQKDLAIAFDELNITNPNYAAAEVMKLPKIRNEGQICTNNSDEVDELVKYASPLLPRRDMQNQRYRPVITSRRDMQNRRYRPVITSEEGNGKSKEPIDLFNRRKWYMI